MLLHVLFMTVSLLDGCSVLLLPYRSERIQIYLCEVLKSGELTLPVGQGNSFTGSHMYTNIPENSLTEVGSDRPRGLYLIRHINHNRQTSIPKTVFDPTIPASEQPLSCVLDRATTWLNFQTKSAGSLDVERTAGSGLQVRTA